jgi:putative membrane protein
MLWLKALHIIFVVTWFAGLFYLPRLFVYHASATDAIGRERFKVMERRLFVIMTIGAVLTALFGALMIATAPTLMQMGWLHAKLTLVAGLIAYHIWCGVIVRNFARDANQRSERWFRVFNEVPTLFLFGIVLLAVVKPF